MQQSLDSAPESGGAMTGGGEREVSSNARLRTFRDRLWEPSTALIAAAILLPVVLFCLAAGQGYRDTLHEAEARAERTARILEEHAKKAFETHRLAIQQVNVRLRFVDWSREDDRTDLHRLLKQLQDDLDQISTISVVDAQGQLRATGRIYPLNKEIGYSDRDWYRALSRGEGALPYVSRAYNGRQSGLAIFNVAGRVHTRPGNNFEGVIAVSADRAYFENFYATVEPTFDHSVVLVREDGEILAQAPATSRTQLPPDSLLLRHVAKASNGTYTGVSKLDGVERIFGYRKVGDYPVYVRFGISKQSALAPWRQSLLAYGLVAAFASVALLCASILALRQTERERLARRRWEETAAALRAEGAERGRIEEQLRQAQKMEAVGRLTGGVAHDFNNLLTAVIGSLDLVRRRADKIDPRSVELITNALEGANRAASLTSRLLAFSRQQPLQPARLDTNKLVSGMSDLLGSSLGETVIVRTILADDLWPSMADPNQLESAVLNLAVNARDAMPGGGTLTIETSNVHLDATYAASRPDVTAGDYVMLSVADTGAGIAAEALANIFEPFFTTKPVGKGTGLGLSQVYGFVRQSGGHIAVYSEVGRGTVFKLYLPRADRAAAVLGARVASAPHAPGSGHGETILVVEDEPMVRRLSVAALEEAGYRVLAAPDGASALDVLSREPNVALLFTDVVLGAGMDGRVLADMIHETRPDLPVLFTTGYTRNAIVHHGEGEEGVALIGKPFTSAALVVKVNDLLATTDRSRAAAAAL